MGVLIILFISSCAFLAGFLQGDYIDSNNILLVEIQEKENDLNVIRGKITALLTNDRDEILLNTNYLSRACEFINELYYMAGNLTFEQNLTIKSNVVYLLRRINRTFDFFNVIIIEEAFNNDNTLNSFMFATDEEDGFDFSIMRSFWEEKDIIRPELFQQRLSRQLPNVSISVIDEILADPFCPQIYYKTGLSSFEALLNEIAFGKQSEINGLKEDSNQLKSITQKISTGVAIIAITTVLSAAMMSRLEDKKIEHNFSIVRKDILKDKNVVVSKTDRIAIPVLVIAAIISALGLVIPILMNL